MNRICVALLLSVVLVSAAFAVPTDLISQGSAWNYTTVGTDLYPNWGTVDYSTFNWNTANWKTANAAFGNYANYGGLPSNMLWAAGTDLALQQSFNLNGAINGNLSLKVASDNGFVLFINGIEAARGMAEGFTNYWEYEYSLAPSWLNQGNNTISVLAEDHGGITFFDSKLTADVIAVPAPAALILTSLGTALVGWLRRR